mgnify:CR=1 FL=1
MLPCSALPGLKWPPALLPSGALDGGSRPQLNNAVWSIQLQTDGKVLAGGQFTSAGGLACGRLARFQSDGARDATYALPAGANQTVHALALQPDGKLLVGGDFTDAFETDDGRVLIMIGDVAGKGVRAAGLTETVRSTVRAFASLDPSPASILEKANTVLLRGEPTDPHVTAFIAVIDPETGHVTYASAGHPAAIHLGAGTGGPLGVTYGPPLHSFPSSYQQEYVRMALGDCLVLYTDGVTESRRDDEEFGEERLVSLARRLSGGDAQSIAEGIRDAAVDFSGGLKDDLLVVTVRLA